MQQPARVALSLVVDRVWGDVVSELRRRGFEQYGLGRMTGNLLAALVFCSGLALTAPHEAKAHGIWAHVHVTGWAIEALPEGDLREFFKDEELLNAAHFGAAFTDSGYWPQGGELQTRGNAYSEHIHWEPFVEEFIHWVRANDPPPWTTQESKKRVAFLLGIASHGLQDEIFDSLFLHRAQEEDGEG